MFIEQASMSCRSEQIYLNINNLNSVDPAKMANSYQRSFLKPKQQAGTKHIYN